MILRKPLRLFCYLGLVLFGFANNAFSQVWNPSHAIGTVTGKYQYAYGQVPDQLVEIYPASILNSGLTYSWERNYTLSDQGWVQVGTSQNYTPVDPLNQTTYYRRKASRFPLGTIESNIIKLSIVSNNWEDRNYIREHDVNVTGVTTWQAVDQLPIGDKLQTTTYLDGLGRTVQKVSRETATPTTAGGLWGDVVQFNEYDAYGRQQKNQLPYTTTTESGKFKTTPQTEQPQYYANVYNETSAFSSITFDNSPLNRVTNVKSPGTKWAEAAGDFAEYDVNSTDENVQKFSVDYVQGDAPVNNGAYPANTLYKVSYKDENGKQVIEYTNKSGQLILKKIQIDDVPSAAHSGWICTYSIYDDLGLLRYQLQPEAVKYLDAHNWSFAGTDGQQVLNELCYQYNYDDKGRTIWKKAPGAAPLIMLYDIRDRLVFTQDGNQRTNMNQWTTYLYDVLDRPVMTTLYNTSATVSTLQNSINSAPAETTVTIPSGSLNGFTGRSVVVKTSINPLYSRSQSDWFFTNLFTVLNYSFYDNYSFWGGGGVYVNYADSLPYSTSDPNVQPCVPTGRTLGMPTGIYTRVLGATSSLKIDHSNFMIGVSYYDEHGQLLQNREVNVRAGTDITTYQYHFNGRMLGAFSQHRLSDTSSRFNARTRYNLDKLGRVTSTQKDFFNNGYKIVASYDYDEVGRIKTKRLDPDYSAGGNAGLESLNYSYNIQNQITGINKDYALKNPSNYNKWEHFFGMYLGYDNKDNVFIKPRLNGQLTGVIWNTRGDDAQRRYDYDYDNAGRLVNASFTEQKHSGDGWGDTKMDFSVTGANGKITYDLNGNLLNMLQKGVQPGNASPITIDNLTYTYASYSNKLQSVTDQMTNTGVNGQFGDFKDGSNTTPDYVYDANGNVVIDLNKNAKDLDNVAGAKGISYNVLDKPEKIRVAGKGTIRIVYSGTGEKLQRAFIPENGDSATITTYIGEYIYRQKAIPAALTQPPFGTNAETLSFINFEEGRIRVMQPVSQNNGLDALAIEGNIALPNGKTGVVDYFIKDYQQNVRVILTEERHAAFNTCTMEYSRAPKEEPLFGQTDGGNEVAATRYPVPGGWNNGGVTGSSVSRLGNLAGHNVGPNMLQKVMAGDTVSTSVWYYYENATGGSNPNFVNTLLTSLGQAITGGSAASGLVKGNVTGIANGLNGTTGFINAVQPTGTGGTTPQAYLTMLFFDERFNFIEATDGGVWQQQVASSVGGNGLPLAIGNVKAPKNGYVFVYVSNQSDQDVYFDYLQVGIARSNIIEENHYYAYGLKIAAISSTKGGDVNEGMLKNDYLYNDKELFDDADLDWYDYGFRNYDPQIGRFPQLDPLTDNYGPLTPYQYGSCDPVTNIDIDGLEGGSAVGAAIGGASDVFQGSKTIMQATVFVSAVKAVKATQTAVSVTQMTLGIASISLKAVVNISDILNGKIETGQVGVAAQSLQMATGDPKPREVKHSKKVEHDFAKDGDNWIPANSLEPVVVSRIKGSSGDGDENSTGPAMAYVAPLALRAGSAPHPLAKVVALGLAATALTYDLTQRTYIVYWTMNPNSQEIYVGRASGYGDAVSVMMRRWARHKVLQAEGFPFPTIDAATRGPLGYPGYRGREQQLYDLFRLNGANMKNAVRPVWRYNPLGRAYHETSNLLFGQIAPFTGVDMGVPNRFIF